MKDDEQDSEDISMNAKEWGGGYGSDIKSFWSIELNDLSI